MELAGCLISQVAMEEKGGFTGRKLPVRVEYVSCPIDLPVHEGNYQKCSRGCITFAAKSLN